MIKECDEIRDMVEDELSALSEVMDVSQSMKTFNKLKYTAPKDYDAKAICKLRKRLHVSQSVFAYLLNAKVTTVQKWEQGVNQPNGVTNRLLQIIEKKGLSIFQKG